MKHVDPIGGFVNQDAREVKTKFSKTFNTDFFSLGEEVRAIVLDWVLYLRNEKLWGNDDPLFPATMILLGPTGSLQRQDWSGSIGAVPCPFELSFVRHLSAPDSRISIPTVLHFRNTLAQLGEKVCKTPEQFKAWSQNLGHEKALTTFLSYGEVANQRQGKIIRNLSKSQGPITTDADMIVEALFRKFNDFEINVEKKPGP